MPKISVIVPVYKAEKYLDACVESVLSQTFADFEIILVDDGSPDQSPALCDVWAERDSRIRVIHKENGGVVSARVVGTQAAAGEYIQYIDADDTIAPEMLRTLYDNAQKHGADIVQCGVTLVYAHNDHAGSQTVYAKDRQRLFREEEKEQWFLSFVRDGSYPEGIDGYVWNKLYKAEIVRQVIPRLSYDIRMREDLLFNLWAYYYAPVRLELCGEPLYYYLQRSGSASHTYDPSTMKDLKRFMEDLKLFCDLTGLPHDALTTIQNHALVGHAVTCIVESFPLGQKTRALKELHSQMSDNGELLREAGQIGGTLGALMRFLPFRTYRLIAVISNTALSIKKLLSQGKRN